MMKCLCGHVEPETIVKEIEIKYQSGPRKGLIKRIEKKVIDPNPDDLFIRLGVEKEFSFTRDEKSWYGNQMNQCLLYACPKCGTVKLFGVEQ